jgi:hypothetical protein
MRWGFRFYPTVQRLYTEQVIKIWLSFVTVLAALKTVVGLALSLGSILLGRRFESLWIFLFQLTAYLVAAFFLILGSRRDRRSICLAAIFFMVGSSFASYPIAASIPMMPDFLKSSLGALNRLNPDSFLPLLVWLFVTDFPRRPPGLEVEPFLALATKISWLAGVLLFAVNVLLRSLGNASPVISFFDSRNMTGMYWGVMYGLILPAFPYVFWRSRATSQSERRRVRLFIAGLTLAAVPVSLYILFASVFPDQWQQWRETKANRIAMGIAEALVLSVPLTTSYSVIVGRVLGFELIVRKVVQYALARSTIIFATALPFVASGFFLYSHREESLLNLVMGKRLFVLGSALLAGSAALIVRERIMRVIDRRYFREQYDSRSILAGLISAARNVEDSGSLANVVRSELDSSLHIDSIALLTLDSASGIFSAADQKVRPLRKSSVLGLLLAGNPSPLHVDLEYPGSALMRLPEEERQWLAEGSFRLLVPVIGSRMDLIGIIALGEKRSELPFSKEDLLLLSDVAASAALSLESRFMKMPISASASTYPVQLPQRTALRQPVDSSPAAQCVNCRLVAFSNESVCPSCGGPLNIAMVPKLLAGKFRIERQIGAGGMGIVFLAEDLELGRKVAIKTLPLMSPERVMRFRREAQAMAAVMHRNLALIFGVEYWHGTPMLILEYLDGGTLADRLRKVRFAPVPGVDLGIVLADALQLIHGASIVHRDIKPSNIGYATDGTPKLMDFGLARMLGSLQAQSGPNLPNAVTETPAGTCDSSKVAGTPAYLPPEAFTGRVVGFRCDLWALSVVLFESIAGKHPFRRDTVAETVQSIQCTAAPDITQFVPDCPQPLSTFFRTALARRSTQRPATAGELGAILRTLRSELEMHPTKLR